MLGGIVALRGREHDPWRASFFERRQSSRQQLPPDALAAIGGIDDDVVKRAGRTTQRHVVYALHSCVGVADDLTVALRDLDEDVPLVDLRSEEPAVVIRSLWCRRNESL